MKRGRDSSAVNFGQSSSGGSDGQTSDNNKSNLSLQRSFKASPCPNGKDFCEESTDYPGLDINISPGSGLFGNRSEPTINLRFNGLLQGISGCV